MSETIDAIMKLYGASALQELMDDMTWVIGYIAGLEEKLMDAVNDGDISHRSACWIANLHDERFDGSIEVTIQCMKRVRQ